MAGRYYCTGVQIGMLKAFNKMDCKDEIEKVLDEIFDEQFIGDRKDFEVAMKPIKPVLSNQLFDCIFCGRSGATCKMWKVGKYHVCKFCRHEFMEK